MDTKTRKTLILSGCKIIREPITNFQSFADFKNFIIKLENCGVAVWDLGNINAVDKNHNIISSIALNSNLLKIDFLVSDNTITKEEATALTNLIHNTVEFKRELISTLNAKIKNKKSALKGDFVAFKTFADSYLKDYFLFIALQKTLKNENISQWPNLIKFRNVQSLGIAYLQILTTIKEEIVLQFFIYKQFSKLKDFAKEHKIDLCSSLSLEIYPNSTEAWEYQQDFFLNKNLIPIVINNQTGKLVQRINKIRDNDFILYKNIIKHSPFDVIIFDDIVSIFKIYEKSADSSITQGRIVEGKPQIVLANLRPYLETKAIFFQNNNMLDKSNIELAKQNQLIYIDQKKFKTIDFTELRPVPKKVKIIAKKTKFNLVKDMIKKAYKLLRKIKF